MQEAGRGAEPSASHFSSVSSKDIMETVDLQVRMASDLTGSRKRHGHRCLPAAESGAFFIPIPNKFTDCLQTSWSHFKLSCIKRLFAS